MATVAPEVRGAQPAPTPPVRHGTCRLTLTIDGTPYRLSKAPAARAAGCDRASAKDFGGI